ncbi:NF-X1-type zinc finger protein NFXL2 [Actinidia rufa]|uniref:NF-X1-type zinc finger protein NFXL2 n=1 Tax=Actinidia rufa TaxID=165716 RepID=A0A7J0EFT2_9ERIC|nr:NF-X1-type zinc finger protein NFXL2 [Actinidia rufa]
MTTYRPASLSSFGSDSDSDTSPTAAYLRHTDLSATIFRSYLEITGRPSPDLAKIQAFLTSSRSGALSIVPQCLERIRPSNPTWSCAERYFAVFHLLCLQVRALQSSSSPPPSGTAPNAASTGEIAVLLRRRCGFKDFSCNGVGSKLLDCGTHRFGENCHERGVPAVQGEGGVQNRFLVINIWHVRGSARGCWIVDTMLVSAAVVMGTVRLAQRGACAPCPVMVTISCACGETQFESMLFCSQGMDQIARCHGPKPPANPEFTLKPKKKKSNHQSDYSLPTVSSLPRTSVEDVTLLYTSVPRDVSSRSMPCT